MNDSYKVCGSEFIEVPLCKTMAFNKKDIYIGTKLILNEGSIIDLDKEYDGSYMVGVYFYDLYCNITEMLLPANNIAIVGTMLFTWYYSCLKKRVLKNNYNKQQFSLFIPDIDEEIPKYRFEKLSKWYEYAKIARFFKPQLQRNKINYQVLETGWREDNYEHDCGYNLIKHKYPFYR